jgi:hypothetical protein
MTCSSCGTTIPDTAQFCSKCGTRVGARQAGWRAGLPWTLTGFFLGALAGVLVDGLFRRPVPNLAAGADAPRATAAAPFAGGGGGGAASVDIASMTPEERASRLYTRVMSLHAAGKPDSAEFFLPMALQAYGMLSEITPDAHYHIGVLLLTSGNLPAALAEADTIQKQVPTHLFADMLRARVHSLRKDAKDYDLACRNYLKHESAELAKKRPEYTEHAGTIAAFHEEATASSRGTGSTGGATP